MTAQWKLHLPTPPTKSSLGGRRQRQHRRAALGQQGAAELQPCVAPPGGPGAAARRSLPAGPGQATWAFSVRPGSVLQLPCVSSLRNSAQGAASSFECAHIPQVRDTRSLCSPCSRNEISDSPRAPRSCFVWFSKFCFRAHFSLCYSAFSHTFLSIPARSL